MTVNKRWRSSGFILLSVWLAGCPGGGAWYSRIDDQCLKQEEKDGNPVDLTGAGNMDYSYTLPCFNAEGDEETFTFGVDEPLENGSFIKLDTQPVRGVMGWEIISESDIPADALNKIRKENH